MNIALCIGINYDGGLSGCENDAIKMRETLIDNMGFQKDHTEVLLGPKATRNMIIRRLENVCLVTQRVAVKTLFISYSGHGSYQKDTSGDEDDGRDEVIVPNDYKTSGIITDDEINKVLRRVHERTTIVAVFDCCYSGTIIDLPYRYIAGNKSVVENKSQAIKAKCIMLSGCMDTQLSSEAWVWKDVYGALTACFLIILEESNYNITCWNLLRKIRARLINTGYGAQTPQITCTEQLHGTYPFIANQANSAFLNNV